MHTYIVKNRKCILQRIYYTIHVMVLNKIDTLLQIHVFSLLLLIRYVNDNKNVTVNQIDQIKKVKIFLQTLILVFVNVSISGREPI